VLDNTGSMGGAKIAALKVAAHTLVDTLFGGDAESPYARIGLVPFANAVNIGAGNRYAGWLDEAMPTPLNGEQVTDNGVTISAFRLFETLNAQWAGCVRSRAEPYDVTDDPPDPLTPATLFTPYFVPDVADPLVRDYLVPIKDSSENEISERDFSHYKDRRDFQEAAPNNNCKEERKVRELTNVKENIETDIEAMFAEGQTVIPEGIAWGWRVISPGLPFDSGAAYTDQETIKVVIVMTDGQNDVNQGNGVYGAKFSSYGFPRDGGHLGPADGSMANSTLDGKTAQVCANLKADKDGDPTDQDIILYTISFDVGANSHAAALMRDCASDPSKYYNAPTTEDLEGVFKSIALGLSKLRVGM
jgi:hypothetical protein